MRYFTLMLLVVFLWGGQKAWSDEQTVSTAIQSVTVYLEGAKLERTAQIKVPEGTTTLVFEGIADEVDKRSLQVEGKGSITIQSVQFQQDIIKKQKEMPAVARLKDSIDYIELKIKHLKNKRYSYKEELQLITANREIVGEKGVLKATDLKQMADFYRNRLYKIKEELLVLDQRIEKWNKRQNRIEQELDNWNLPQGRPAGEIHVKVTAQHPTNTEFTLSYYVRQAGWTPLYDLRVDKEASSVNMTYKAKVWQRSKVSWESVNLTLSTRRPTASGNLPSLSPWWIDFYEPPRASQGGEHFKATTAQQGKKLKKEQAQTDALTSEDYTKMTEHQLSTAYDIQLPYTIPPNGKKEIVEIQEYKLPATFQYFAVPKLKNRAYLKAQIMDWEQYNLLSGPANVFQGEQYIGETVIEPRQVDDTLQVSLGQDRDIVIQRNKETDFTEQQFLGNKKKETYGYTITIKNTKEKSVTLQVKDQIPRSKHEDIEVELEKRTQANFNSKTGELVWPLQLPPASSKELTFVYSIKYPKDKTLDHL